MRDYLHTVDEQYLRRLSTDEWAPALHRARERMAAGSTAEFNLGTALDAQYQGVCYAWAFGDDDTLAQLRAAVSRIIGETIDHHPAADVHRHSTLRTLARAGVATDVDALRRYADLLDQRPRHPIRDRDPHAYRQDLIDTLIHLIAGRDSAAQAAVIRFHQHLHHPRTPPDVAFVGLPHLVQSVIRGDQAALDDAAGVCIERHVDRVAPFRDRLAGPTSLLFPTLSLVCRTATWRGMTAPVSCYILAEPDSASPRTRLQPDRRAS